MRDRRTLFLDAHQHHHLKGNRHLEEKGRRAKEEKEGKERKERKGSKGREGR